MSTQVDSIKTLWSTHKHNSPFQAQTMSGKKKTTYIHGQVYSIYVLAPYRRACVYVCIELFTQVPYQIHKYTEAFKKANNVNYYQVMSS